MKPPDDMTPAELDHAIAVEVMGWTLGYEFIVSGGVVRLSNGPAVFSPASDPTKLHQAVEAWKTVLGVQYKRVLWIDVTGCCAFFEPKAEETMSIASRNNPGEAICRAALKAAREKKWA